MSQYTLPDDLYSYQKEDLDRLLSTDENFMNLSEMGTGKTPVSIGLARSGRYRKTLVVCPKTLRLEWARQILDWTGEEPDVSKRGSTRRLETLFGDMLGKSDPNPWFIVNYETLRTRKHLDVLNLYPFDLIIMDEVHRLRNSSTSRTRGMFEFLENHRESRIVVMTGSPIVNKPEDLHTILEIVKPDEYTPKTRREFEYMYTDYQYKQLKRCRDCGKVTTNIDSYMCLHCGSHSFRYFRSKKLAGVRQLDELRRLTAPYTIRRTMDEALPFLPKKYYRRVILEMDPEQRDIYEQMERELFIMLDNGEPLWAPGVLAQITRLRQLNVDPNILGADKPSIKLDFLMDLIDEVTGEGGKKLVVFCTSEDAIMRLHFHPAMPRHILISGHTPVDDRVPLSMQFNRDPDIEVCLATIGPESPGGEGLTLTGAHDVFFLDRWWTPVTNSQAEDRLHRITQKSAVQVIIPVIENSIDESFDRILEKKRAISEEYLGESTMMEEVIDDLRKTRGKEVPDNGSKLSQVEEGTFL